LTQQSLKAVSRSSLRLLHRSVPKKNAHPAPISIKLIWDDVALLVLREEQPMTTSFPAEHWVLWFMCLNAGILAFLGLAALIRVFESREEPSSPDKEIVFDDEFRGEV
jgi:hypothetical protein